MNFVFFRAKNFVPNNITLLQNDEKMNEYVTHKIQFRWLKWKKKKDIYGDDCDHKVHITFKGKFIILPYANYIHSKCRILMG